MLNPILYTEQVVRDFLRYQLTAYPFSDTDLYAQMRTLLSLDETRNTPLMKGPYISLSRAFRMGASVKELVKENVFHPAMSQIAKHEQLFGHQEKAIRSITSGKTTLISTGTGSGKTECFLYPIISHCLRLRDENAVPGISAVLVYPMNALAEDQLERLRELLVGSGVSFGMYVGKTPERRVDVAGLRLPAGASRQDYLAKLQELRNNRQNVAVHPEEERASREEMREPGRQPRILLTNVKQLELLLTRQQDIEMFRDSRLDFLVFDEAHTFKGAMGAETACLIRRLRSFCGRPSSRTTCVATSATMMDPERGAAAAEDFAIRFFGVDRDHIALVGEEYEPHLWNEERSMPAPLPGDQKIHLKNVIDALEDKTSNGTSIKIAYRAMTGKVLQEKWQEQLYDQLSANELLYQISAELSVPKLLFELTLISEKLHRQVTEEEILVWLVLAAAASRNGRPFLRPVIHSFIRGVQGAIVTFPEDNNHPRLWLSAEDAGLEENENEKLYKLAVTTCTTCGQHYIIHSVADFQFYDGILQGGELVEQRTIWKPLDQTLGGSRLVLFDHLITQANEESGEPDSADGLTKIFLCRYCGTLASEFVEACDGCGRRHSLIPLFVVRQKEDAPGYLTSCVSCQALGRNWSGGYRESARAVRAITVSDVHVLAQNMLQHADHKRLLVFADNRQDAAFQAGWMRDHARRYRLRGLMYQRLKEGPLSVGDLIAYLDRLLDHDDELSEAVAPEVWRAYRKTSESLYHREDRKTFLRIQVLREITTGIKQRIGLEPWGRLRVDYVDLNYDHSFFKKWSQELQISPQDLQDGVASLLDNSRRNLIIHDSVERLYGQFWHESHRFIQRGYMTILQGVPRGLRLKREFGDDTVRVQQWLSARGETLARKAAKAWGIAAQAIEPFFQELWQLLTEELSILVPVTFTGSAGRVVDGCVGIYQIDADKLMLSPSKGFYRCQVCRRIHSRPTPQKACLGWRCDGRIQFVEENPDDYDLYVLDQGFGMIRPEEHSAQVPGAKREQLERAFKEPGDRVNTLVCTPTLELGVDIGSLDSVLMRNVPPTPANYWQRAGRAGRRMRMAVNMTYARPASHDRAYYKKPEKLLQGVIQPPRFNMRNELMIAKHVHAVVITMLYKNLSNNSISAIDKNEIRTILAQVFPHFIKDYFFDSSGNLFSRPLDISALHMLVSKHSAILLAGLLQIFITNWPEEAMANMDAGSLEKIMDEMTAALEMVIQRVWKRLQWALAQMHRLEERRRLRGTLDPEDDALLRRCDRLVKKMKGIELRNRRESEGYDDTNTFAVLAAEGFLPGYGLEVGQINATAHTPRGQEALGDFDLPRLTAVALREYVPGNLIYANGNRFVPRYYHLQPNEETLHFNIDLASSAVSEASGTITPGMSALPAVPICDVELPHSSHISDEEEFRFQIPVDVFGYELARHGGGKGYRWSNKSLLMRHNLHLRLVNVGIHSMVQFKGKLGYPVCRVCGQSRSPISSQAELDAFARDHYQRCGHRVQSIGFYADVVADALSIQDCADSVEAFSVMESLRFGAAQVIDMEQEDLQILTLAHAGSKYVDVLLYDPMPGGSGLLEQVLGNWRQVVQAALEITKECPSLCDAACIDCLLTFRNAHYHRFLSRRVAIEKLTQWGDTIEETHAIAAIQPDSSEGSKTNTAGEERLRLMLKRAGFPEAIAQKAIELGLPMGRTLPDFYYDDPNGIFEGICIYLDGMGHTLHGNAESQRKDRIIREELRSRNYMVYEITQTQLDDYKAMAGIFYRLGAVLLGKDRAAEVKEEKAWFE